MQKYLIKLDRIAAWVLLLIVIAYAISGYGMTKGIINPDLARKIHLDYLAVVVLVAFVIHTSYALHLAFKRWNIWNNFSKFFLLIIYILLIGFFVYVGVFYNQSGKGQVAVNQLAQSTTNSTATSTGEKVFTLEELKKFNGQNEQPAYVAVDGLVYDLSSVFRAGYHAGYPAGTDLTQEFHRKHDSSILSRFEVVGKLN